MSRWDNLVWPLMALQTILVCYDFSIIMHGRIPHLFYVHAAFVVIILGMNVHYLSIIETEEAFNLLNIGNILDRRYVGFYLKIIIEHWRILYYSIGFSISFFLVIESFHQFNYFEIVAINSFLLALFQRAPLYIRRQKFFDGCRQTIEEAQQATIMSIIDNRVVCQERMVAKRGIREIYDAIIESEATIMSYQQEIGRQVQIFEWMTNPNLQYFAILRYTMTWILTNIVLRVLVQYR